MNLETLSCSEASQHITSIRQINMLWCERIINTLVSLGVRNAVICPGGRSAAMALVLNECPQISTLTHTDERSASFMALGMARATRSPVLVCTTSGSAAANLLPAATEAEKSRLPLVVLTCKRIFADVNNEAPQVADHMRILAAGMKAACDLPAPTTVEDDLNRLSDYVRQLAPFMVNFPLRGPVHLNVSLYGSFTSLDTIPPGDIAACEWKPVIKSELDAVPTNVLPPVESLAESLGLKSGMKGLIIAGCESPLTHVQMAKLAEMTGFPILADAMSGYRRPAVSDNLVCSADLMALHPAIQALRADIIIRTGLAPCSHTIHSFLKNQNCPTLKIGSNKVFTDFTGLQCYPIAAKDKDIRQLGAIFSHGDAHWKNTWVERSKALAGKLSGLQSVLPWGELVAADIICNTEGFAFFHLANSMSARHGNIFCRASTIDQPIYGNRGLNGIDGTLGTFFGELLARKAPGLLMLGDLSLIHDLPALEAVKQKGLNGCICVMNNNGGGIFSIITKDVPQYDATMRNPVPINLSGIASAFDMNFRSCDSSEGLRQALSFARGTPNVTLIDIRVPYNSLALGIDKIMKVLF